MVEVNSKYLAVGGIITLLAACQLTYYGYRASLGEALPQHRGELPHGHDTHDYHGHVVKHRRDELSDTIKGISDGIEKAASKIDAGLGVGESDGGSKGEAALGEGWGGEVEADQGDAGHEGDGGAEEEEGGEEVQGVEAAALEGEDHGQVQEHEHEDEHEDHEDVHEDHEHEQAEQQPAEKADPALAAEDAWKALSTAGEMLHEALGIAHPKVATAVRKTPAAAKEAPAKRVPPAREAAAGHADGATVRREPRRPAAKDPPHSREAMEAKEARMSMLAQKAEEHAEGRRSRRVKPHKGDLTCAITMSASTLPGVGREVMTPWRLPRSRLYRSLGKVTPEMLRVMPNHDVLSKIKFKTCAVVGSAGLLLRWELGPEIDQHDAVFRFNIAPAKGFEKHVGSKTTIRLVNRMHFGFRETPDEVCLQHVTTPEIMKQYVGLKRHNKDMKTYAIDMSFYEQVINWRRVQQPTNGYFGLRLALMLCERVEIYGFLRTWQGWVPYHYFNKEEPNKQQATRDNQGEMPIIERLVKQHKDRMVFKHPCIVDKSCEGCSRGAHCAGSAPYPVAREGYCQRSATEECYVRCPGGAKDCPGWRPHDHGRCPKGIDGVCS